MEIRERALIVSGGSSGLGAACVRLLAKNGGRIAIADVNQEAGQALAKELDPNAIFVHTDVTNEASVQAALVSASKSFGPISGAVLCAGIGLAEKILGKNGPHALAAFERVIRVNLIGSFNFLRLAAAAMAENAPTSAGERGVVVMTASVAAFEGQIGQAAYSASKGGVVALTLPAARELARSGIRVMAIAPGIFDTPLLAGLPEAARVSLGQQVPFPSRLGRPDEFAALVKHIIENEMLNGTVIRLDGAMRMAAK